MALGLYDTLVSIKKQIKNICCRLKILEDKDVGTVTSVNLSMPSAFNVSNNPVTTSDTLTVTGAGTAFQYVRGDGQLATLPSSPSVGGASISYYLNGSIPSSVATYEQMSKNPILGIGTDYTTSTNGLIAQFLTDAGDPSLLNIPGGAWLVDLYFNASSAGGSPNFYLELYKYDGAVFTLIASNSTNPEFITNGTAVDLYITSLAVPTTTLALTDRLAIRVYVDCSGKTVTLHTEDGDLSSVTTTFANGIASLNGLTKSSQFFTVGSGATYLSISSSGDTHTFNLLSTTRRHDFSTPYSYNGWAPEGSLESNNVWTITRINVNVDGSTTKGTATNVSWTGRASHTYIQDYYTFDFINCDSQYKTVYSSGSSLNIGVRIFTNSSLTTSATNDYYCIDDGNYTNCWVVTGGNGVITSINHCN